MSQLNLKWYQPSGRSSNDGKQVNVLTGQGSYLVAHPMSCCMMHKTDMGKPMDWIQCRIRRSKGWLHRAVTDNIVNRTSDFLGKLLTVDFVCCPGEVGFVDDGRQVLLECRIVGKGKWGNRFLLQCTTTLFSVWKQNCTTQQGHHSFFE